MANRTVTVKTTGGDYTTFNAALAGEVATYADLVTNTMILTIECYNSSGASGEDTTAADTGTGWTTSADYYINITASSANMAGLSWSASKYRLEVANATVLRVQEAYTRVTGIQAQLTSQNAAGQSPIYLTADTTECQVSRCFLWRNVDPSTNGAPCLIAGASGGAHYLFNSVLISTPSTAGTQNRVVHFNSLPGGTLYVYYCTVIGGEYGIVNGNAACTTVAKNCYAGNSSSFDFIQAAGTLTRVNCASEDTSADGTNPVESVAYSKTSGAYFAEVSAGSEDLRFTSVSSALYDAGVDVSGESAPLNITTDMLGTTRTRYDIGAFEYVAAATSSYIHGVMRHHTNLFGGGL